ncbi:MAG: tRNA uridine-5-carboxymethylaminomethyl(34) synthesis GTPase MnmE [Immundisolibacteraceae bacterium]|nr:tRNA uridine-5-carboxymethylaminomethyl(34) synthesis GTPase MnmE [Immundisolibacteraceae bacterium]
MAIDTIVARATPPGRGGVAVIRLSGPKAATIATTIAGPLPAPRQAVLRQFKNSSGDAVDSGLLLYFPAPNSFTGEEVVELQCHGGPVVVDLLIDSAIRLGARLARPGEFSQRAFLNDRLDLVQAEAIADLIDATSEQAALSAQRVLKGEFSTQVNALAQQMMNLRVYIEAALDFPDEEIDFLKDHRVTEWLASLQKNIAQLLESATQGNLLRDGIRAVIAGPANVGKSTLLNALAGQERAIVTDIAGTTRDLLRETVLIDGLMIEFVDTAGIRDSDDPVELAGIALAEQAIRDADLLLILDAGAEALPDADQLQLQILEMAKNATPIVVTNKIDITGQPAVVVEDRDRIHVHVSAKSGAGLELLRTEIAKAAGFRPSDDGVFIARRRHLAALSQVSQAVEAGSRSLVEHGAGELLAEELRVAQESLGEITGTVTSDDLLGAIFSSFCIGK